MGSSVLDASALLALLAREPGHELVAEVVLAGAVISAVNLSEVVAKLGEAGAPEAVMREALDPLGLDTRDFGQELVYSICGFNDRLRQIQEDNVHVIEAIQTRSSIGKVTDQRPPREVIEKLLSAAVRAPNHHLTQPWRFFVVAGEARRQLGDLMAALLARKLDNPESEQARDQLQRERTRPLRAPVLIIVAACPTRQGRVVEAEEIAATAAAVENLLLAAHGLELGAVWRTGDIAHDVSLKRWLGLRDDDHVLAIVYLGYPAIEPRDTPRKPVSEVTRWMGWEER